MKLYQDGIQYPGFALIDIFSPCVTFNKQNTYEWFRGPKEKPRIYKLEDVGHDPADYRAAIDKALEWGEKIPIGLFYRNPNPRPPFEAQDPGLQSGPLAAQPLGLNMDRRAKLIEEFV